MLVPGVLVFVWWCLAGLLTAIPAPPSTTLDPRRRHGFFPDPRTDVVACSRTGQPSWVCDPSRFLLPDTVADADAMIWSLRNQSVCPCAQTACRDEFSGGYKLGVAVIESLTPGDNSTDEHSRAQLGRGVAENIRLNHWSFGACHEDLVLLLSVADRRIYMSVGDQARRTFVFQCELQASSQFTHFMAESGDYNQALLNTIRDIKDVLMHHKKCGHQLSAIQWWHILIMGAAIMLLIFLTTGAFIKMRSRTPTT